MREDLRVTEKMCACGRPLKVHVRHVRFGMPDPVLDARDQDRVNGAWLSHADGGSSVMMRIPGVGSFVRALLPVDLTGGYTVTFGVWVGIDPDELQRAFAVWWEPAYKDLRLSGRLANAIGPWGLLAASVDWKSWTQRRPHTASPVPTRCWPRCFARNGLTRISSPAFPDYQELCEWRQPGRCGRVQSRSKAARIASVSAASCSVSKNPS
jgi:hypothetical protein